MAYRWIKLYHEILDDPKMGQLPDHLWRRVVELFLAAGRMPQRDGTLPPLKDLAWMLHTTAEQLQVDLEELMTLPEPIIEQIDGHATVTKFATRQAPEPSQVRTAASRERHQNVDAHVTEDVTNMQRDCNVSLPAAEADQEADQEADRDADKQQTGADAPAVAATLCPALPASASLLADFGVGEPALSKLACLSPPFVQSWIDCIRSRPRVRSPAAMLVRMLESGADPPPARASPTDDRASFISGPYADYFQH